jgi:hypothetical protein
MARRPSFLLSPAGIVLGYLLALFAATAGVLSCPFSILSFGLSFVVVGAYFAVAVPVIVMAYLFVRIAFSRGYMSLARRLLVGSDQQAGWQRRIRRFSSKKDAEPPGTKNDVLWDKWIDGSR